jgi:ribosomal protein L29
MKTKITETNPAELRKQLEAKRADLAKFKLGMMGGKAKNVKLARTLRRQIAQILTKLNAA